MEYRRLRPTFDDGRVQRGTRVPNERTRLRQIADMEFFRIDLTQAEGLSPLMYDDDDDSAVAPPRERERERLVSAGLPSRLSARSH